jgi:hypothetical protein
MRSSCGAECLIEPTLTGCLFVHRRDVTSDRNMYCPRNDDTPPWQKVSSVTELYWSPSCPLLGRLREETGKTFWEKLPKVLKISQNFPKFPKISQIFPNIPKSSQIRSQSRIFTSEVDKHASNFFLKCQGTFQRRVTSKFLYFAAKCQFRNIPRPVIPRPDQNRLARRRIPTASLSLGPTQRRGARLGPALHAQTRRP